jgi:hypothetical protein
MDECSLTVAGIVCKMESLYQALMMVLVLPHDLHQYSKISTTCSKTRSQGGDISNQLRQ